MSALAHKAGRTQSEGFWDRPLLMNHVADIVLFLSLLALGYVALTMWLRMPFFPLRELVVVGPLQHVTQTQVEYVARSGLSGNFFTVDLDKVRAAFERLPWVRRANARRLWPNGIELALEEHVAAGVWRQGESGESTLVNVQGEVFAAANKETLPVLAGPIGSAPEVLERYREFSALLAPIGHKLQSVSLSARLAWTLRLDDGLVIELGRDDPKSQATERLARFLASYRESAQLLGAPVAKADLRYANGFALKPGRGRIEPKGR
jgi:cell division protein FtsQ